MIRDKIKNKEYFEKYLKDEQSRIDKFVTLLSNLDTEQQRQMCSRNISNCYRNKINAMYSVGYSKDEIRNVVMEYLNYNKIGKDTSYADIIDTLSFIILFNIDVSSKLNIVNQDTLIRILNQYILNQKYDTSENINLDWGEQYKIYVDLLYHCEDVSYDDFVSFINNNWYDLNKDLYWYDTHKSKNDTYTGYWCWIGAAVAKILNIPDNYIDGCKYVPKDAI